MKLYIRLITIQSLSTIASVILHGHTECKKLFAGLLTLKQFDQLIIGGFIAGKIPDFVKAVIPPVLL